MLATVKLVACRGKERGPKSLLYDIYPTPPSVSCVPLYCQMSKQSSKKDKDGSLPVFSASSMLCGCLLSDRSTRFWAWSLCRRPRPALATANVDGMAAKRVKGRGRAKKTKRKKPRVLDLRLQSGRCWLD